MLMLRRVIDGSSLLLGKIKRNRRVPVPAEFGIVKVNLGCGLAVAPGWINIDGSLNAVVASFPRYFHSWAYRFTGASRFYKKEDYLSLVGDNFFIHHDLSYSLPLADEVVDFVYSSHFFEHLFRKDGENLLKESYRVLRPGGMVRVSVPDLHYAWSLYAKGDKEKMLENYFFVSGDDSYYARHKYMYDYEMLAGMLAKAGFRGIRRCAFCEGRTPDLALLDNRPDESIFVEAEK